MAEAPQTELQKLVYDTLRLNADIAATVGGVYDRVPSDPYKTKTSYISFGPSDTVDDGADCVTSGLNTIQVDIWSMAVGQVETKRLVHLVTKALHLQELALTDNALAEIRVEFSRVFTDSDGLTTHGLVSVTASIEEP
ncbi:DUF3168 domain-containing protein [Rhizobium phaseoli]|uniref:DUF3168 domain-containing protein n=1 Tax=Rhizobium phaseoli TaxID=396 RepID=UPI002554D21D|nr:DUF3168 domain-containing protein [Rhizobium phaseoli]MDK4727470.1 DUF3168 domain-containing protein [Rhizobium phaseoli]